MRAPVAEAEPAEVVTAVPTRHVVAALVLLNKALALGTRLCIGLDPGHVFT